MTQGELQDLLDRLLLSSGSVGVIAGWSQGTDSATAGVGVANLSTGAPMLADTLFLTGSITKVWTTSLAMTFVDDATLDLHQPIVDYLPEFRVADSEVTKKVTPWHLLNHSSGWDAGDLMLELGEGPDAHRALVERLANVGQVHELGRFASYCNSAWVVLSAVLEDVTGRDIREHFAERIFAPLGLTKTCLGADNIGQATAVGAVLDPLTGERGVPRLLMYPKTFGAAGATLFVTAEDSLRFFRMHLHGGVADDGTRVLSEESVRAMATPTVPLGPPGGTGPTSEWSYGLGWCVVPRGDRTLLWHSGGSIGGDAVGGIVPDADLAYIAFTSGGDILAVEHELTKDVFPRPMAASGAGGESPSLPAPDAFIGRYSRAAMRFEVYLDGAGALQLSTMLVPEEYEQIDVPGIGHAWPVPAFVVSPNEIASGSPDGPRTEFYEPDENGRFQLFWAGARVARRVG